VSQIASESLVRTVSSDLGVEVVDWPRDEALRGSLARAGVPRLLVLAPGQAPPEQLAFDEDWIRAPFEEEDLRARARNVAQTVTGLAGVVAWIDTERVLHRGARTAVLTASEAVVASELLSSSGSVVTRAVLESRLWPVAGPPSPRAVDAVVYRLRRRCRDLGLLIRATRGEGFVLVRDPG